MTSPVKIDSLEDNRIWVSADFGLVLIIRKSLKKLKAENLQEWQVMLLSGKTLQCPKYAEDSKSEDLLTSSYTSYTSFSAT